MSDKGSPITMYAKPIDIPDAEIPYVVQYVAERTKPVGDCIEWIGHNNGGGRGIVNLPKEHRLAKRSYYAYRVTWFLAHGHISNELSVCHRCDNPLCVNVDHLFLGTHQENMADMARKGRYPKDRRRLGSRHHKARHDDELVDRVLAAWGSGSYETYADLGREYGVHRATVRSWVTGMTRTAKPVPEHVCAVT